MTDYVELPIQKTRYLAQLSEEHQAALQRAADHDLRDGMSSVIPEFWAEKIAWALAGDRTPEGRQVIRCGGKHYVLHPHRPNASREDQRHMGMGGSIQRFRLLDGTIVESNDTWFQGQIPLELRRGILADNADSYVPEGQQGYSFGRPKPQPARTEKEHWLRQITRYGSPRIWQVHFGTQPGPDGYDEAVERTEVSSIDDPEANCYSSELAEGSLDPNRIEIGPDGVARHKSAAGLHILALDVDHRCHLIPSSTNGHWHLVIDHAMPWHRYRRVLKALTRAGILQPGYYSACVRRRASFLRLPWAKKEVF